MPKKIKKRSKKNKDEEVVEEDGVLDASFDDDDDIPDAAFDGGDEEGGVPAVYDEVETFGDIAVAIPEHERDAFQEASVQAAAWIEENRPAAMGIFFAILLVPFGVYAAVHFSNQSEIEASKEVSESIRMYQYPIEGSPEMQVIEQNDKIKKPETVYPTRDAKWEAIYKEADGALAKHSQGDLSVAAKYAKAGAAYNLGKYDEAIPLYEEVLADARGESLHVFARLGLAMAQAGKGDVDAALSNFDELAASNEELAGLALYHKGRVLESAGKTEEAKKAYHELLESEPETTYKSDVERRLAIL